MKLSLLTSAAAALALVSASAPTPRNDHQVTSLPNFPAHDKLSFAHFAGQLELDTAEKLFYWYTESQQDATKDPIVLWLNGGPGCSSVSGLFTENGPFVVDKDLSIQLNAYAWNRKANVVWVESPAGVGFSAPEQPRDYYNDDVVADRLHQFLAKFLAKYPELKDRDFYITGESYAGMYIPYLVNALVDAPIPGLALKGFAIGNPLTDNEIDGNAYMDYYYYHALVSRQTYHKMLEACSNEIAQCTFSNFNCSATCQAALDEGYTSAGHGRFNAYYIYGDVCQLSNGQGGALQYKSTPNHPTPTTHRGAVGPCADTFTEKYLNKPELQTAVHLADHVNWVDCNPYVSQHFTRSTSSLPKYRNILGKRLKALIYSGDADSVVNFIGTERWITQDGLDLQEVGPWHAWYGADQQLAGYEQEYDGLTFKTVKGAGHMVPAIRPLHGLQLFECFVYGNETCATFTYPVDAYEVDTGLASVVTENNIKTSGDVGDKKGDVKVDATGADKKTDATDKEVDKKGDEGGKSKAKHADAKTGEKKKDKDVKKSDEKDDKKGGEKKKKDKDSKTKDVKKGDEKKDKEKKKGDKKEKDGMSGDEKKDKKDKGDKKKESKGKGDDKDKKKDKGDKKGDEKKKDKDGDKKKGDKKDKDDKKGKDDKKKETHVDDKKDGKYEQFAAVRGATMKANAVANRGESASSSTVLFVAGAAFAGVAFFVHKRMTQRRRDYERIPFASVN